MNERFIDSFEFSQNASTFFPSLKSPLYILPIKDKLSIKFSIVKIITDESNIIRYR